MTWRTQLCELVETAYDGLDFYNRARERTAHPAIRNLFNEMAAAKESLIGAISFRLQMDGRTVPTAGTTFSLFKREYAQLLAKFLAHPTDFYVRELEQVEDELLEKLERAICECPNPEIRHHLEDHLPLAIHCYQKMSSLDKWLASGGDLLEGSSSNSGTPAYFHPASSRTAIKPVASEKAQ
jgi:uncharacterized protein (TIGR02284 family)